MTEPEDHLAALKLLISDAIKPGATSPQEMMDQCQPAVDYAVSQGLILDHGHSFHVDASLLKVIAISAVDDPTFTVMLCGWTAGVIQL